MELYCQNTTIFPKPKNMQNRMDLHRAAMIWVKLIQFSFKIYLTSCAHRNCTERKANILFRVNSAASWWSYFSDDSASGSPTCLSLSIRLQLSRSGYNTHIASLPPAMNGPFGAGV